MTQPLSLSTTHWPSTTDHQPRPHLAVTLGDPAGIGPEVILKAFANPAVTAHGRLTVVGSRVWLDQVYHQLRAKDPALVLASPDQIDILDVDLPFDLNAAITLGQESEASGAASFQFLETAIAHTLAGQFQGIVTGPIAKSAWQAAGHDYPGQTELLAERAGVTRFGMLFVARSPHTNWTLRTLLATTHIPLQHVSKALSAALLTQKLDLLLACLAQDFGLQTPHIVVAGLNPHSGEQGKLGHEEQDWLIPWMHQMRDRLPQIRLDGPIPPDTMWVKPGQAWFNPASSGAADGYLALYHDQGLIPVKLMAFDRAVNTTIGLPFVRTSPDHGTAFDIAGLGVADATSMEFAISLGAELCQHRQQTLL